MSLTVALNAYVGVYLLVAARLLGLVLIAPVIGSLYIPPVVRAAVGLMLALAVAPAVAPATLAPVTGVTLMLGLVVELAIGLLMGLVLTLVYSAFGMAGELVTYQMGIGLAVQAAPGLLSTGSVLSDLFSLVSLFVFVAAGGLDLMMMGLTASFKALPVTALVLPSGAIGFVSGLFQAVLLIALLIAGPLLVSGLVVQLATGIISRAFPQMNVFFLALPVNLGVSLLVLLGTLPLFIGMSHNIWRQAWQDVSRLLVLLEGRVLG